MSEFILLALLWVAFGVITSNVARAKGRDPFIWFFIGLLFGWVGLIIVFLMPKVEGGEELVVSNEPEPVEAREDDVIEIEGEVIASQPSEVEERLWFYLDEEHQQMGPLPESELRSLLEEEKVSAETLIWCEGQEEWAPLKEALN